MVEYLTGVVGMVSSCGSSRAGNILAQVAGSALPNDILGYLGGVGGPVEYLELLD